MPKKSRQSKKRRIRRPSRPKLKRGTGTRRIRRPIRTTTLRRPVRPVWRPRGRTTFRRRYRSAPMSSGACIALALFFAIIILMEVAPSFTFEIAPDYSFILLLSVVIGVFIIAFLFITKLDLGADEPDDDERTTIIEREKVLVICPYCGTKNDQGRSQCINCDGAL